MISITPLSLADLPEAFEIEKRSHLFPWSEHVFQSNQGERYFNLKLTVNQRLVGFAITQCVCDEATLFNVAIDPHYQKNGYGKVLLQQLIDSLDEKRITTLWLEVRESNTPAIRLYDDLGFQQVTVRKNYYPTEQGHENALVYVLTLSVDENMFSV